MQAALKNTIHATVLQPRTDAAGLTLCPALPAVGARKRIQVAHDGLVTRRERAWHFIAQDQQIGDQPGFQAFAVDPVIASERRYRAQDRRPLKIVEGTADTLVLRQEQV